MEPDAPELRKRLPVLRLQKTELDRFLLDQVAVDHDCVRLEGAAAALKKTREQRAVKVVSRGCLFCSGVASPTGFEPVSPP